MSLPLTLLAMASTCSSSALRPQDEFDVRSAEGRYLAELRESTAGTSRGTRWDVAFLEVRAGGERRALGSALLAQRDPDQRCLLSDDGSFLAVVEPLFAERHRVLSLLRPDRESVELTGRELGVRRVDLPREGGGLEWLAAGDDAAHLVWDDTLAGPVHLVVLRLANGAVLRVDGHSGRVVPEAAFDIEGTLRVEPAAGETDGLDRPYVSGFELQGRARAGVAIPVRIHGRHPTPGWRVVGFELRPPDPEGDGGELTLLPLSRPPADGGVVVQVLEPFECTARLFLPPGTFRVNVGGREDRAHRGQVVVVEPAGLLCELRTRGGIAGIDETLRVFRGGVSTLRSSHAPPGRGFVPRELRQTALGVLKGLAGHERRLSTLGADLMTYELAGWSEEAWVSLAVDDLSCREPERGVIRGLRAIGR